MQEFLQRAREKYDDGRRSFQVKSEGDAVEGNSPGETSHKSEHASQPDVLQSDDKNAAKKNSPGEPSSKLEAASQPNVPNDDDKNDVKGN